jgi:hypothetical protein
MSTNDNNPAADAEDAGRTPFDISFVTTPADPIARLGHLSAMAESVNRNGD